jgi:hypothetical protein
MPEFITMMDINIMVFRDGEPYISTFETKIPAAHVEE